MVKQLDRFVFDFYALFCCCLLLLFASFRSVKIHISSFSTTRQFFFHDIAVARFKIPIFGRFRVAQHLFSVYKRTKHYYVRLYILISRKAMTQRIVVIRKYLLGARTTTNNQYRAWKFVFVELCSSCFSFFGRKEHLTSDIIPISFHNCYYFFLSSSPQLFGWNFLNFSLKYKKSRNIKTYHDFSNIYLIYYAKQMVLSLCQWEFCDAWKHNSNFVSNSNISGLIHSIVSTSFWGGFKMANTYFRSQNSFFLIGLKHIGLLPKICCLRLYRFVMSSKQCRMS